MRVLYSKGYDSSNFISPAHGTAKGEQGEADNASHVCSSTFGFKMNTEVAHPILGRLLLVPTSLCWTGSFSNDGVSIELNLETFYPDQVPGLHVTTIRPEYCEAFERVKPMIASHIRSVADWIRSELQSWFEGEDLCNPDVIHRLRPSCVVLKPDGTSTLWIDEPYLYETGHSIEVYIGTDGNVKQIDLAG